MASKKHPIYVHCFIGISEDDEEVVRMDGFREGTTTGQDILQHFVDHWPKVLGANPLPMALLRLSLVDADETVKNLTAPVATYPAGGDVEVQLKHANPSMYCHADIGDGVEMSVRLNFLSYFGKSISGVVSDVRRQLSASYPEKKFEYIAVSVDSDTGLDENDALSFYPPDGDLFIIKKAPAAPPVEKEKKKTEETQQDPSTQAKAKSTADTADAGSKKAPTPSATPAGKKKAVKKSIKVDFDPTGTGKRSMSFDYWTDDPLRCQYVLMQFAIRMGMNPHEVCRVVCLTADHQTVIPDDFLLAPEESMTYEVVDRPSNFMGKGVPFAKGCISEERFKEKLAKGEIEMASATSSGSSETKKEPATTAAKHQASKPRGPGKKEASTVEELDSDDDDDEEKETAPPTTTGSKPKDAEDENRAAVMKYLDSAEESVKAGQHARALEILHQLEAQVPPGSVKVPLLSRIAHVYTDAGLHKKAVDTMNEALKYDKDSLVLIVALGKAYEELEEHAAAAAQFHRAVSVLREKQIKASEDVINEIQLRLGMARYGEGKKDEAVALIQPLALEPSERKEQGKEAVREDLRDMAIVYMCKFYAERQMYKEAITWAVQLLVKYQQKSDEAAKRDSAPRTRDRKPKRSPLHLMMEDNFATVMDTIPNSFSVLKDEVLSQKEGAQSPESSTAWGFMGLVLRDRSKMKIAQQCYEFSLELKPDDASVALNYAHLLEQTGQLYESALYLKRFFLQHKDREIGGLSCQTMSDLMGESESWPKTFEEAAEMIKQTKPGQRPCLRIVDGVGKLYDSPEQAPPVVAHEAFPEGGTANRCTYTEVQLSLLCMYFSVVKVLFALGALNPLPALCAAIDPLKVGQTLHRTTARNEQAYYATVQMLVEHLDPGTCEPFDKLLYFVGDSHSLPPSWHTIRVRGESYLIVNCLVTGLKCWHLRPSCQFYTKANFECQLARIPKGADVLFLFGEIDCREGVVASVEKARYKTPEEGMEVAINHYLDRLLKLQAENSFSNILIHSVIPCLKPTRHFVVMFNKVLKALVKKRCKAPPFRFVFADVLTDNDKKLKPGLVLDDTHIHPSYVTYLQEGVEAAFAS